MPAHVVAEQLGAQLVVLQRDGNPAERAPSDDPDGHGDEESRGDAHQEELGAGEHMALRTGNGDGEPRYAGHAVVSAEGRVADAVCRARCRVHEREQHQAGRQGDDRHVYVGDVAVEHEVAQQRSRDRPRSGGCDHGGERLAGVVREVDGPEPVGVAADAVDGGLAEAEDAALSPHERERQSEDRLGGPQSPLEGGEFLHQIRQHRECGERGAGARKVGPQPASGGSCGGGEQPCPQGVHRRLRRPVRPWGMNRRITMAAISSIAWPMTGVN